MALSSDEIVKREVIDQVGHKIGRAKIRIFPESSNDDQKPFSEGGLTFGYKGALYGSCDACWVTENPWINGYNGLKTNERPILALEGTDARNRRSSGNAQYQRFHHVLGAVKNGLIGVYYLRPGKYKIQEDLYGMAYSASKIERGTYLITEDLKVVKDILLRWEKKKKLAKYIEDYLNDMNKIFKAKFNEMYGGDWKNFAKRRSTIIKPNYVIKHAGRMRRNFTDSSQRAGHIAVGEMFVTKYYFPQKQIYYLFPKMTNKDLKYLDTHKSDDKEWYLLRNEPKVTIKTLDDIKGIDKSVKKKLIAMKDQPLKGDVLKTYNKCIKRIVEGLEEGSMEVV